MNLSKMNFTMERLPAASQKPPARFHKYICPAALFTLPWILGEQRGSDGTHEGSSGDMSVTCEQSCVPRGLPRLPPGPWGQSAPCPRRQMCHLVLMFLLPQVLPFLSHLGPAQPRLHRAGASPQAC